MNVTLVSILDLCHQKGSMAFLMVRQGNSGLGALALLDWFGGAYFAQMMNLWHYIFVGTLCPTAKKVKKNRKNINLVLIKLV